MNALLAAGAAATSTLFFWTTASAAAGRRGLKIGALPPLLAAFTAAAGYACAFGGLPASAITASAGAAVAGVTDARTGYIFDPLTIAMLLGSFTIAIPSGSAADALCGTASVGGTLLFIHLSSHKRGLGLGDVKLGAALGMGLGFAHGMAAIALAFVFGGVYGTWLLATKRANAGATIRFGPFIAAGTFAALLAPIGGYR